MRRTLLTAAAGAAALWSAGAAQAGTIENTAGQFDAAIAAFQPLGQTFTAIDTDLLSIGFAYSDINPGLANDPITLSLYSGDGVGGALLAARTFTLPAVLPSTSAPPVIVDTDFSGTSLTIGAIYTAALTVGSSFKVAAVYGPDAYAGGHATSALSGCTQCDLDFRVVGETPVTTTPGVPEPASWALMLLGFGGLGALLRRRRQTTPAAT